MANLLDQHLKGPEAFKLFRESLKRATDFLVCSLDETTIRLEDLDEHEMEKMDKAAELNTKLNEALGERDKVQQENRDLKSRLEMMQREISYTRDLKEQATKEKSRLESEQQVLLQKIIYFQMKQLKIVSRIDQKVPDEGQLHHITKFIIDTPEKESEREFWLTRQPPNTVVMFNLRSKQLYKLDMTFKHEWLSLCSTALPFPDRESFACTCCEGSVYVVTEKMLFEWKASDPNKLNSFQIQPAVSLVPDCSLCYWYGVNALALVPGDSNGIVYKIGLPCCSSTVSSELMPSLNIPRSSAAITDFMGTLYATGGLIQNSKTNECERYDTRTKAWVRSRSTCNPASHLTQIVVGEYLYSSSGESLERFDGTSWETVTEFPLSLGGGSVFCAYVSGSVWVFGTTASKQMIEYELQRQTCTVHTASHGPSGQGYSTILSMRL